MRTLLLGLLISASAFAAPDPPKHSDWPIPPVVPDKMPPVTDVSLLSTGVLYVVQGDGTEQLLSSPAGVVKVTELTGPIGIYGKFIDGTGQSELRTYSAKQVWVVERLLQGQVELLKTPKGKIERRTLGDGTDPIPSPKPKPIKPEPITSFRVIFVYESADTLTAAQKGVIFGNVVEEYLKANTTAWRRRDKDAAGDNDPVMKALWADVQPEFLPPKNTKKPAVVIQVNETATIKSLPGTQAEMVAMFKEFNGGK